MSMIKKVIIGLVIAALVAGGTAGGLSYMKKANQQEVMVVSVDSVADDYYMPSTTLDGTITSNVSQQIKIDKDVIIDQVYVNKGDSVKKGDKLITFDMTLVEMELNIARLKKQQQEQDMNKAVNRLNSLKNGGPVQDTDASPVDADKLGNTSGDNTVDNMAMTSGRINGNYLAYALPVYYVASAFTDMDEDETQSGEEPMGQSVSEDVLSSDDSDTLSSSNGQTQQQTVINNGEVIYNEPGENLSSGSSDLGSSSTPEATPTPDILDPTELNRLTDGDAPFYMTLDYNTEPFTGTGTKEDPYVFLCSSAKGKVTLMGSFFNKMAGYNEDGTEVIHEGGSWFQLEFHQNDTIADFQDRKLSCTGYYYVDGSLLSKPVYMFAETELTLEEASRYETDEIPDDSDNNVPSGDDSGSGTTLTRAEAIKIQKSRIASLKLDIQESDIKISKLEKKSNNREVYSKLDGTVVYVGDPVTGTSTEEAFLKVKSKEGFYVKGSVSELLLDHVREGTMLNCSSYDSGSFEAKVIEVSDYPVSGNNYWGDGNPNVSYYTYTAEILDQSLQFSDQSWVSVTLQEDTSAEGSIVLSKAFVRTENGTSYVYKDDNGVLKKQIVLLGGSVNGGYSVRVKGGLSREDKIAFPYGKTAKDGVKTKEATLEEMYGY